MSIIYHEQTKEFHLYNDSISYIIKVLRNGQMGQVYFGSSIPDKEDFGYFIETAHRPMTSYLFEGDLSYSLEHLKQEYPSYGTTDYREPAFEILQENGSRISDFVYKAHKIYDGKPGLKGLPAITRSAKIRNCSAARLTLARAMSACLDLPDKDYEWIQLSGAWSRERQIKRRALQQGIQAIGSIRGNSSHNHNPFVALKRPSADEFQGEALGMSLVYSGNFLMQAEVDTYDVSRVLMGIHPIGVS